MAVYYINGVNIPTLKKIVYFIFGVDNVITTNFNKEKHEFTAYIKAEKYNEKPELVEYAEEFWNIQIKPMEI